MSTAARPLVIATANPGKLREFRALLHDLPFSLTSLGELGIGSPEESGRTFVENALIKARHAARAAGMAAIADDSGLEVDALGGSPGVHSARYAGPAADDAANNRKLIAALEGVPAPDRRARYRCVLALLAPDEHSEPTISEGVWEGVILERPRGAGGFGYDPYFWIPALGLTAAELDPALKNRLSHRGTALQSMRAQIENASRRAP